MLVLYQISEGKAVIRLARLEIYACPLPDFRRKGCHKRCHRIRLYDVQKFQGKYVFGQAVQSLRHNGMRIGKRHSAVNRREIEPRLRVYE